MNEIIVCEKCGRVFSNRQALSQHIKYCDGNPISKNKRGKYGTHSDYGNYLKGKTYEEIYGKEKSKKIKDKLSSAFVESSWNRLNEEQKQEMRLKLSLIARERYDNGWDPKAGRAPKYKYKDFTVDGSWELEFCKWADESNLYYERNFDRFDYEYENKRRKYKPDFKLSEEFYIEVKGYQTDKDLEKWKSFPHSLIVLKRSQINRIKKRSFSVEDLYKYIWSE